MLPCWLGWANNLNEWLLSNYVFFWCVFSTFLDSCSLNLSELRLRNQNKVCDSTTRTHTCMHTHRESLAKSLSLNQPHLIRVSIPRFKGRHSEMDQLSLFLSFLSFGHKLAVKHVLCLFRCSRNVDINQSVIQLTDYLKLKVLVLNTRIDSNTSLWPATVLLVILQCPSPRLLHSAPLLSLKAFYQSGKLTSPQSTWFPQRLLIELFFHKYIELNPAGWGNFILFYLFQ